MTHFYIYQGEKDKFLVSNPTTINVEASTMKFLNSDMKLEEVSGPQMIEHFEINNFKDFSDLVPMLKEKYGLRRFLLEEKTRKKLRHRLCFTLLGGSFWNVTLEEIFQKHTKEELKEPPLLYEIFDSNAFNEALAYFKVKCEIPDDIRNLMV